MSVFKSTLLTLNATLITAMKNKNEIVLKFNNLSYKLQEAIMNNYETEPIVGINNLIRDLEINLAECYSFN